MRLIDADAFDKMLKGAQAQCKKNGGNFRFGVLENVRANLAIFPTEDRPEIVLCKDCKNAEILPWLDNAIICKKHNYTGVRPDEFYCADGERQ